jgi:hypothetical protein
MSLSVKQKRKMADEKHKLLKDQLEGRIKRLRKASKFFRDNKNTLRINMYKDYTIKYCDLVDSFIDMVEGDDPDIIQTALDIFPGSKVEK